MTARLLLTAAALLASASQASAAALMGCPSPLRPPPCITLDTGKIKEMISQIRDQRAQLEEVRKGINELRSTTAAIGGRGQLTPISYQPIARYPKVSFTDAANSFSTLMLPPRGAGADDEARIRAYAQNAIRNIGVDSLATSIMARTRMEEINQKAQTIRAQAEQADNLSADWQANTAANLLLLQALALRQEIDATRTVLRTATTATSFRAPTMPRTSIVANLPATVTHGDAERIGQLQTLADRLRRQRHDAENIRGLHKATAYLQETLAEFNLTKERHARADLALQRQMQELASLHNRRTGRRMNAVQVQAMGERLYSQVLASMSRYDLTGWADENKGTAHDRAVRQTLRELDDAVSGSLPNGLRDIILARHDTAKEVQFFTPIAKDAEIWIADNQAMTTNIVAAWELIPGPIASLESQIRQKIAATEAELRAIAASITGNLPHLAAKRDSIMEGL